MSYEADKRYDATVVDWDFWSSDTDEALTLELKAKDETATLRHFLWLTEKGKERTAKTLAEFGVDVRDESFWREMEEDDKCRLVGQPCNFTTKLGKNGKVQTQYLNGPHRQQNGSNQTDRRAAASKARALFAGGSDSVPW